MKIIIKTIFFLLFLHTNLSAQKSYKPIKWVVRPSFGLTRPLSSISGGYITDNLLEYDNKTYYWQIFSTAFFIKNLGLEISLLGNNNSDIVNKYKRFVDNINKKYSDNYYVEVSSGGQYNNSDYNIGSGSIEKWAVGPEYKIEKDRLLFIGRTLIGNTSFNANWGSAKLKGKGTNEVITINWDTPGPGKNCFTFNPSITIGYRLLKRIILDLDLNYWLYNINFEYTETLENKNTGNILSQKYKYVNMINEFSVGLGFMFVIF